MKIVFHILFCLVVSEGKTNKRCENKVVFIKIFWKITLSHTKLNKRSLKIVSQLILKSLLNIKK